MKCPTCKIGNLDPDVRDVPYVYKGKKTVIKGMKGKFCDNPKCDEVVMDKKESARTGNEGVQQEGKRGPPPGLIPMTAEEIDTLDAIVGYQLGRRSAWLQSRYFNGCSRPCTAPMRR